MTTSYLAMRIERARARHARLVLAWARASNVSSDAAYDRWFRLEKAIQRAARAAGMDLGTRGESPVI
jgi:hypothetical protein